MRDDSVTPLVFTEEWIRKLRKCYAGRRPYLTNYVYRVATFEGTSSRRRDIEKWISLLSDEDRSSLIPRLRSNENHCQTYHELAIGALLVAAGLPVRYEDDLGGGFTPDWTVRDVAGQLLMVVEVLTANPSESDARWQRAVSELFARLDEVPVGLYIHIRVEPRDLILDERHLKLIEDGVRKWLAAGLPPVGSSLPVANVTLTVRAHCSDWTGVRVVGPARPFRVDYQRLALNLHDKARKYGDVTSDLHIPLVVAVVADPLTGYSAGTINRVLSRRAMPKLSAVFSARPTLEGWSMLVTRNPKAVTPLTWAEPQPWSLRAY